MFVYEFPTAAVDAFDNEIQIVTTSSSHDWEVQRIRIHADAGNPSGVIGGYFTLSWGAQGPSRPLPADVHNSYVKVRVDVNIACTPHLILRQYVRPLCW